MSYDHKPVNPNRGNVSRSGNVTGFAGTDRHPSDAPDMHPLLWALAPVLLVGLWILSL